MARFSAEALRGARVRAPRGFVLRAPPVVPGAETRPGQLIFAIDGPWHRRHLLTAESAALVTSLTTPRRLAPGSITSAELMRMVMDGLLEVEHGGRFHAGGAAHRRFFAPRSSTAPRSRIMQLSYAALTVAALPVGHRAPQLADRLYRSNALPRSPHWLRRCPHDAATTTFLAPDSTPSRLDSAVSGPWRVWEAHRGVVRSGRAGAPTYKLYVSATPEATGAAATALLETIGRRNGPFSAKLGQDTASVLRPDRLVAYFDDPASLRATAARLKRTLADLPAQGVPFTAPLDTTGLMSWGADFAFVAELGSHSRERSWRGWITSRLATALVTAHCSGALDPVGFALDRVALDGVHVGNWAPSIGLLRQHGAGSDDAAA